MKPFVTRHGAMIVAVAALVFSFTGLAEAGRKAVVAKLKPGAAVRVDKRGKIPRSVLPFTVSSKGRLSARALPARVPRAARADRLGTRPASAYVDVCPDDTVDLGTWCLMSATFSLDRGDIGKNDYGFANQACAERGGFLPDAGMLIAAAPRVKLSSTLDDVRLTASIDEDATDGLKDRREMSSTLVTVASGSSAAGSTGVTPGSKGDPKQGEPDPIPAPADPMPTTLQYVTVFDNRDKGGVGGSKPLTQAESFRCAFVKAQPGAAAEID